MNAWRMIAATSWAWIAWSGNGGFAAAQDFDRLLIAAQNTAGQLPAAKATADPSLTGDKLVAAVREALRHGERVLKQSDRIDVPVVRELIVLNGQLKADGSQSLAQREMLRKAIREQLAQVLPRVRAVQQPSHVLAQQLPGFPGNPQPQSNQPTDHGPELVDLIQNVLAPDTWDTRGGQGVIRYWGPSQALVVRQSATVHEALGQLLIDLR